MGEGSATFRWVRLLRMGEKDGFRWGRWGRMLFGGKGGVGCFSAGKVGQLGNIKAIR